MLTDTSPDNSESAPGGDVSDNFGAAVETASETGSYADIANKGTEGGTEQASEVSEESFYSGNPADLDPLVRDSHYKPMQASFTEARQKQRARDKSQDERMAELDRRAQDLDSLRASILTNHQGQGAATQTQVGNQEANPPAMPSEDELWAQANEFDKAGDRQKGMQTLIGGLAERRARELFDREVGPMRQELDALKAQLHEQGGSLEQALAPVRVQEHQRTVTSAYQVLVDDDPTFNDRGVRDLASQYVNGSTTVKDALGTGSEALVAAAVAAESYRAMRAWEAGRAAKAGARAGTSPSGGSRRGPDTTVQTGGLMSISDSIANWKKNNADAASRISGL